MPPQQPSSFQPDSISPSSFVPDTFVADEEDELQLDEPEEDTGLYKLWKTATTPLWTMPSQAARHISSGMNAGLNDSVPYAQLKGFGAGALEGLGDLASGFSSPLNLATMLASGGSSLAGKAGLSGLMRLLDLAAKGAGSVNIAHGGYQIANPESTGLERIFGAAELAGGASAFVPHPVATPRAPKVLPPEMPPIRPQLQLGEGNFIAGPGGVERAGLVRPDIELQMLQNEPAPTFGGRPPLQPEHPGVDLAAVKEAERLANIFYTGHEQAGGSRMEIPDQPFMSQPPVAGDTGLGFDPESQANLPYPLNIVPNTLRPREAQTVTSALAPERFAAPLESTEPVSFGNEIPAAMPESFTLDQPDFRGGTAALEPGEPILPSAPPKLKVAPFIQEGERVNSIGQPPVDFESRVTNHVQKNVEPAVPGASEVIAPIVEQNKSTMRRLAEGLLISGERQLEKLGPVGQELSGMLKKVEFKKREFFNRFADPYINAVKHLTPEQTDNFVTVMEGDLPYSNDPVVQAAVTEARKITTTMGEMAEQLGTRVKTPKGKIVPFKAIKAYWPHRPVKPIARANFINELMNKNPKLSQSQAEKMASEYQSESEWFNSPQHSRMFGDFEWRRDHGAMIDHMADMADILARGEVLGPGDIGNRSSAVSQLIDRSPNVVRTRELMRTALRGGMDKNNDFYQAVKAANRVMTKSQVFSKLGLFTIGNLNNQLPTMLWGHLPSFAKSVGQALTMSPTLKAVAKEYGTIGVGQLPVEMLAEVGRKPVPIVGGIIRQAENFARTIATGTGIGTAKSLFKAAQAGDKLSTIKLQNLLVGEDVTSILQQEKLNPEQLKLATQRFVELSQQLNSNAKLPPAWVDEPLLHMFTIFKKMAFQGTKSVKDAIMQDPKRNIPLFLIAAPMFGELTGDLKSAIYGVVRGAPSPDGMLDAIAFELAGRHKFAGKLTGLDPDENDVNWLVDRIAADMIQSWGLGLVGDMLQGALGGKDAGYSALAGPYLEQLINVGTAIPGAVHELAMPRDEETYPNTTNLGREGLRALPIIGPGLQRRLLPTEAQNMEQ